MNGMNLDITLAQEIIPHLQELKQNLHEESETAKAIPKMIEAFIIISNNYETEGTVAAAEKLDFVMGDYFTDYGNGYMTIDIPEEISKPLEEERAKAEAIVEEGLNLFREHYTRLWY